MATKEEWQKVVDKLKKKQTLSEEDYNEILNDTPGVENPEEVQYSPENARVLFQKLKEDDFKRPTAHNFMFVKQKPHDEKKEKSEKPKFKFSSTVNGMKTKFNFFCNDEFIDFCERTRGQPITVRIPADMDPNIVQTLLASLKEFFAMFDKPLIVELVPAKEKDDKKKQEKGEKEEDNQKNKQKYLDTLSAVKRSGVEKVQFSDGMNISQAVGSVNKAKEWADYIKNAKVQGSPLSPFEKYLMAYNMAYRTNLHGEQNKQCTPDEMINALLNANDINLHGRAGLLNMMCKELGIPCQFQSDDKNFESVLTDIVDKKYGINGTYVGTPSKDALNAPDDPMENSNKPSTAGTTPISPDTMHRAQTSVNMALDQTLSRDSASKSASAVLGQNSQPENSEEDGFATEPTLKKSQH